MSDDFQARLTELEASIRAQQASWADFLHWSQPDSLGECNVKMTYRSPSGRIEFEVDITGGKQAFEVVAKIAELFEEPDCGCCKSKNIRPEVRQHEDYVFYNLKCGDCGAQLDFGQKKDGKTLFAKRWDKDNKQALPNRGWHQYQRQERSEQPKQEGGQQRDPYAEGGADIPF